ncbi:MAG: Xaa-Pro peptidase family protein [Clostridiales bacterium]|nr:Xaa-Pro peptidase family protein [Clostridiales bacterium]
MNRIEALRSRGISCALYDDPINIRYLTGYTGEGSLLVLPDRAVIITDFRYVEQAQRQSPFCDLERVGADRGANAIIAEALESAGIHDLPIEENIVTVSRLRAMEKALPGVHLTALPETVLEMRTVKDEGELDCIRKALAISCQAFDDLLGVIHAGMTEKRACAELNHFMNLRGSEGNAFDTIVASGVNGSLPHAVPSDKVIEKGDLVTFDFGAKFGGYCADMTRTIAVGEISSELHAIYDAVLEAQLTSEAAVKPGAVCRDIDKIARDQLEAKYPGAFGHSLGHGVGLFIHELPRLSFRSETILQKGHVVTVEPGVYVPGVGGCRIEDTVIVTEDGFENPVTTPKQLIVV